MKILVLMPVGTEYAATGFEFYKNLSDYALNCTVVICNVVDYLLETNAQDNYGIAVLNAITGTEKVYEEAVENNEDVVIFGNVNKKYDFDLIFNFQDVNDDTLPYEDKLIDKMREISFDAPDVSAEELEFYNLHTADESQLTLKNSKATAELISELLASKPIINHQDQNEQIKKIYKTHLEELTNKLNIS